MYSGLEVRVPFCDHRIVEYAYNMPWEIKSRLGSDQNREKGIVRAAVSDLLPDEIVYRKKSPYPKTHNPIYTEAVCNSMNRILANKSAPINEIINPKTIRSLISNPTVVTDKNSVFGKPWYGQLMRGPQILAYLIQVNTWLSQYSINIQK
jgi:asparagine synthase (glutamine-hydrolysing)